MPSAGAGEAAEEAALRVAHGAGVAGLRRLLPAAAAAAPEEEGREGDDAEGGDGDADDGAARETAAAAALALLASDELWGKKRVGVRTRTQRVRGASEGSYLGHMY